MWIFKKYFYFMVCKTETTRHHLSLYKEEKVKCFRQYVFTISKQMKGLCVKFPVFLSVVCVFL